ncbi:hypothetical protein [Blastococcus sp. SYSU D00820]
MSPTLRASAAAAVLLLAACGSTTAPGAPDLTGGPVPDGPFTTVLDDAAIDDAAPGDVPYLNIHHLAGGPGVVHVLAEIPWDSDAEDPPPPPDLLLSYPVGDGDLGDPVVTREEEDYPATTGAPWSRLTTTADGDAWLLAERADDGVAERPGTGTLVLVHVDVQTGEVTSVDVPIADYPPDPEGGVDVEGLDCGEDGVCAAVVSDGWWNTLLITIETSTGRVLARSEVPHDEDHDLVGPWLTPDGEQVLVMTVDESWAPTPPGAPSERLERPALEVRDADTLAPVGAPVPLAEGNATVTDVQLLDDGTLVALRVAEGATVPEVVRLAPGAAAPTVDLRLTDVPGIRGLAVDPATGWLHVLSVAHPERPRLVGVDPATGERTTAEICPQGNVYGLVLTGAGAVVETACRHDGLWLVGPA